MRLQNLRGHAGACEPAFSGRRIEVPAVRSSRRQVGIADQFVAAQDPAFHPRRPQNVGQDAHEPLESWTIGLINWTLGYCTTKSSLRTVPLGVDTGRGGV